MTRIGRGRLVVLGLALVGVVAVAVAIPVVASAHGGLFGFGRDGDTRLADALGITVDELRSAQQKAAEAEIAEALASGDIGTKQADLMTARLKAQAYLDPEALTAAALGMTPEQLRTEIEGGKTLRELVGAAELDTEQWQDKMQTARDEALARAVKDGALTQEQSDLLESGEGGFGCAKGGGFGHGMRGMGGPGSGMGIAPGGGMGFGPGMSFRFERRMGPWMHGDVFVDPDVESNEQGTTDSADQNSGASLRWRSRLGDA